MLLWSLDVLRFWFCFLAGRSNAVFGVGRSQDVCPKNEFHLSSCDVVLLMSLLLVVQVHHPRRCPQTGPQRIFWCQLGPCGSAEVLRNDTTPRYRSSICWAASGRSDCSTVSGRILEQHLELHSCARQSSGSYPVAVVEFHCFDSAINLQRRPPWTTAGLLQSCQYIAQDGCCCTLLPPLLGSHAVRRRIGRSSWP